MKYKVKSKLWLWNPEKGSWHFATVPPELSKKIETKYKGLSGGWGSFPVNVYFKDPENKKKKIILETSIFKNKRDRDFFTFILPVKKKTRVELGVQDGDIIDFEFEIRTSKEKHGNKSK